MKKIWAIKEQLPRERLIRLGAEKLSDQELITTILGSGNKSQTATQTASRILSMVDGSLRKLFKYPPALLKKIPGLGTAKYCALTAGMELGRRMLLRYEKVSRQVSSAKEAYYIIREHLPITDKESVVALCLDNNNRILACKEISGKKFPSGSEIDLRELLSILLTLNASSVILAHNHPSGNNTASTADIKISKELDNLLSSLGIILLDHLIITEEGYSQIEWHQKR